MSFTTSSYDFVCHTLMSFRRNVSVDVVLREVCYCDGLCPGDSMYLLAKIIRESNHCELLTTCC